jgi:hypothetical protein
MDSWHQASQVRLWRYGHEVVNNPKKEKKSGMKIGGIIYDIVSRIFLDIL